MDSTPPSGTTVLASPNVPGPTVRAGVGNAYQGIRIKGKAKVHQGDTGDTITNNTTNIYFKRDDTTRLADIIDITKNLVSSDKTVTELLSSDDISTASHHNARNKPKKMGYGSRALQRWLNDSTQGRSTQVPTQEHASQPERSAERAPGFQEALMHSEPLDIMQDLIAPETEPAPSYALCLGGPAEAKIALAQTMKEDDHLGLFWEVRQPLHALYGTGDPRLRPKKRKITILLLSVDGNVECWTMLDTWRGRLQKLHPNMKHIVSSPKGKTLMLNNICVLDKHQKSFCGVQLTFKVIDSKRHFKDIPQSADDGDIFSVLCFNILDHRNFDKTVEMVSMTDISIIWDLAEGIDSGLICVGTARACLRIFFWEPHHFLVTCGSSQT